MGFHFERRSGSGKRDREAVPVAQAVLEAVLPGPGACPVAATGVGEHEQFGGAG